jgi:hypothetical protein
VLRFLKSYNFSDFKMLAHTLVLILWDKGKTRFRVLEFAQEFLAQKYRVLR